MACYHARRRPKRLPGGAPAPETDISCWRVTAEAGVSLGELDAADVDMFTLVTVGNSETRHIDNRGRHWVYTPRGYRKKL